MLTTTISGFNLFTKFIHQNFFKISICSLLLSYQIITGTALAEPDKSYLRIEQSKPNEENDLTITTIGALIFENNMQAHVDLSYLDSDLNGQGGTLDFGGGYVFNWNVSVFLGIGISLGYNWDNEDPIATYYPEAGIVVDITKSIGLTVSARRIYNLYDQESDIIMLGMVFR